MPIFMKYDGIKGQVKAPGFEGWIELNSCQMGVHRNVSTSSGHGGNREASTPAVSEIVCTKNQDASSADLFKAALAGEGKKVDIAFCKTSTDGKKYEKYMSVELENTLVSSYNLSGHGGPAGDSPMESLSLNFTKITYTMTVSDEKNKVGTPSKASWDMQKGTH